MTVNPLASAAARWSCATRWSSSSLYVLTAPTTKYTALLAHASVASDVHGGLCAGSRCACAHYALLVQPARSMLMGTAAFGGMPFQCYGNGWHSMLQPESIKISPLGPKLP